MELQGGGHGCKWKELQGEGQGIKFSSVGQVQWCESEKVTGPQVWLFIEITQDFLCQCLGIKKFANLQKHNTLTN